ncbi:MAG: LIC12192 family sporadic carbohydrate cluster protein [Candidatus Velthaea sp.]|jgi:sporadic carbohydrate cluster protein (TIGR04323 family)
MSEERDGFRGYIASRPVRGTSYPQRVQNLVVRTYAQRNGLAFKLSLTEYAMRGSYMILATLLDELPKLGGIIFFSMFMLPEKREQRLAVYERVLAAGCTLHAALEETVLRSAADLPRFEDTIAIAFALEHAPLGGRIEKDGNPLPADDPFVQALTRVPSPSST